MSVLKAYKVLSEYKSDNSPKTATVVKELGTKHYIVRMMNDSGSYFTASVVNLEEAENYAQEWVDND
jgi:hypothetical protein